ncbi:MAG: hypothetical protein AAGF36_11580 [Pseudomonadota bacterium]
MRWVLLSICAVAVAGCDLMSSAAPGQRADQPDIVDAPGPSDEAEPATPDTENAPEPEPEVSVGTLGRTVASLGNAAEPGLWLKTPLVSSEQPGRVYYAETNTTVDVTLIPIEGPDTAGSRLSLSAMQALGAPLTGLPEVDVFGA